MTYYLIAQPLDYRPGSNRFEIIEIDGAHNFTKAHEAAGKWCARWGFTVQNILSQEELDSTQARGKHPGVMNYYGLYLNQNANPMLKKLADCMNFGEAEQLLRDAAPGTIYQVYHVIDELWLQDHAIDHNGREAHG